jgi:hypothetical protein
VLAEAAKTDFEGTVAWIAAHPGRLSQEDMMGIANAVTTRMNDDPVAFLTAQANAGSLKGVMPAIGSALLNGAAGQRAAVWDWLRTQPDNDTTQGLKRDVLNGAAWQDPSLAVRLAADLPRTAEGDSLMKTLATSLLNGGSMLYRLDKLLDQAPDRLRQPLLDNAFNFLRSDTMADPQTWIARLPQLPEATRTHGIESIARAWAGQAPEEAVGWISSLPAGEAHSAAVVAATAAWASKDAQGAAQWVAAMAPGGERDRSAGSLASSIADKYPRQALDWALSIGDAEERNRVSLLVAQTMMRRDPAGARQIIEAAPLPSDMKASLQAAGTAPRGHTQ